MRNIQSKLNKYDNQIVYISGYKNCNSIVKCYCYRCNNIFERRWSNITKHDTEYSCPICQTKLGMQKAKINHKQPPIQPVEDREHVFIEKLNKAYPNFEYVSGYTNSDSPVKLRCRKCGYEFNRNADCIRAGRKPVTCFNCRHDEIISRQLQRKQKAQISNLLKQNALWKKKQIKNIEHKIKTNTIYITKCKMCGNNIETKNKLKAICDICSRKHKKKNHSNKSLKELYKRDNGICYICGSKCDYEDYIYRGNTFIAGNYYPSIDHVIPLNKGGTDNWDNLKLAHRICNSLKRDIEL